MTVLAVCYIKQVATLMSPSPPGPTQCSNISGILPNAYMAQNQFEEEEEQSQTNTSDARW